MPEHISIVIPAYNEEARLGSTIARVLDYMDSNRLSDGELIVVDDGSSDGTVTVAKEEFAKNGRVRTRVIDYGQNRGKGYAVREGLKRATGEIALFTDADLSTPIEELPKLIAPIISGDFDVTFGSRALDRSLIGTHQPWRREQGEAEASGRYMSAAMSIVQKYRTFEPTEPYEGVLLGRPEESRAAVDVSPR